MDYATATRAALRIAVQERGLGGSWTALAQRADLIATLETGERMLSGRKIDVKGQPLAGFPPPTIPGVPIEHEGNGLDAAPLSLSLSGSEPAHGPTAAATIAASVAASVEAALGSFMADALDVDRVEAIALRAAASYCEDAGLARPVEYVMPDLGKIGRPTGRTIKGFSAIAGSLRIERLALLVGPTGSGKTHAAQQLAESLTVSFYAVSCSGGMSESWLVGRTLADGRYVEAQFVTAWRNGGLFLLDEYGACPDDVGIILNAALANNVLVIPSTGESIQRHSESYVVAADNTWGRAYSAEYSARSVRDLASANRFVTSQFWIDYDRSLERKIARDILGPDRTEDADLVVDCMVALRKGAKAAAIEGWAVSTRQIVNASKHLAAKAATLEEIVGRMMLSLAEEERERVFAEAGDEGRPWVRRDPKLQIPATTDPDPAASPF
jgi:MoxR-like ATPase